MGLTKIGFIGTGVMGSSIINHLIYAGYELHVFNRTKSKAEELIKMGAIWHETPAEVTKNSDVIFTIVGYPQDVEEVYLGKKGILNVAKNGQILIDMTTSTPTLAEKIYNVAKEKGASVLDAPVSGGDLGAQKGTLTIMVGGNQETYDKIKPLFNIFSSKVNLQGLAGSGQHTKMANQIMVAGTMTGMTEMMVYADKAGLNLEKVIDTVESGSAQNWSLSNYGPRILKENYSPGFFVKHFVKDLKIALGEAKNLNLELPATEQAEKLYESLENKGNGNDGTQALIKLWWE